jgi:hypothetical protein
MAGETSPGRHQFVFVARCGDPVAVVEGQRRMTEASAFNEVYANANERSRAFSAGIRVLHVSHEEYMRTWHSKMLAGCPHQ